MRKNKNPYFLQVFYILEEIFKKLLTSKFILFYFFILQKLE